jgi:hypothetical protein
MVRLFFCSVIAWLVCSGCGAVRCSQLNLRVTGGSVWAASNGATEPRRVWPAPAAGQVEGVSIASNSHGYLVEFRQGGRLWRGALDVNRLPRGPLMAIEDERTAEVTSP